MMKAGKLIRNLVSLKWTKNNGTEKRKNIRDILDQGYWDPSTGPRIDNHRTPPNNDDGEKRTFPRIRTKLDNRVTW